MSNAGPFQFMGIAFPFQIGTTGFPASATNDDLIKQSLMQLIMTGAGERIMRPAVGSNAYRYLFENQGPALEAMLQHDIATVISQYEPRVILRAVQITYGSSNQGTQTVASGVIILIQYVVVSSRQNDELSITIGSP